MKRSLRIKILIIISVISISLKAQDYDKKYFRSPVDIPIRLVGNFGEIRPNHFHSGIDIKVPCSGVKLFAAADGYVSRIRKSPGGYGNALYINHPNGLMTVYGHMQKFNSKLEEYTEKIQYELNKFEFTMYPDSNEFPVKKGELIGYAGNTGRSYGPHLHFEIRETEKDVPVNPLYFNFNIKDNIKPKIFELIAYPIGDNSTVNGSHKKQKIKIFKGKRGYYINKIIHFSGEIGFSIRSYDYLNGVKNTQGIYSVKMEYDGKSKYSHKFDKISFYDTRYINSFIDYQERQINRKKFQKCFIEPGNKLDIYDKSLGSGIIKYEDNNVHFVKITASDFYNNSVNISFKIKGTEATVNNNQIKEKFFYNEDNYLVKEDFRAYLKKGSLYDNTEIDYKILPEINGLYSKTYQLNSHFIPIHDKMHIAIRSEDVPKELIAKALIIYIDKTGKYIPLGGNYLTGFIAARSKNFGKFAIAVDNTPPTITIEKPNSDNDYSAKKKISFIINDNLSGINNYYAEIDGRKIIFEYDEKNNRISYTFDNHILFNKKHKLIITVFDKKNNKSVFETNFFK
ncbi:MAG: M23 family metallopeptidase [Bacteroidales bacterium]|nr:M23 family metallopeptidase [Bacteroidales bacterium]